MALAFVQSNEGTSTSATTNPSFAVAPASGNLIVLGFASDDYNGTPDTGWTQSTNMEQQTFHGGYIWWRISDGSNPPGGYTIGSATVSAWALAEFSGHDVTPYDVSDGTFLQSSGLTMATPTITPSAGNRLLVAMVGGSHSIDDISGAYDSWTNSFTEMESGGTTGGATDDCVGLAYRIVVGDGSTTFTTTADYSGGASPQARTGLIISFKEDTGAAPPKFASKGSLGVIGNTTANQASIVLTTQTTAVAIGDLAVIVVGVDNSGTTDTEGAEISGVVSSPANTWIKAKEFTNGQAAAQAGATVSMWYTVATAAMAVGSTVTVSFTSSANRDAQAVIGWVFTKPAGDVAIEGSNTNATDGADPPALDATTRAIECLRIRGIGSEGAASGTAPSLTPTGSWTAWGNGDSAATMSAAEAYARAEHIISVGTGSSSNPTSWAADNASVYVAFRPPCSLVVNPYNAIQPLLVR